ncbi:MAG: twin-arginine translocation signal domain-containing protein [Rhodospirillaceae bacterium]|nr:twin-arginine translocation signal domain-containing protein [Rhodospirillaceae bacterium]
MSEGEHPEGTSRRSFLQLAGAGTVASGVAALTAGDAAASEAEPAPGSGYRETRHIKSYYDSARF